MGLTLQTERWIADGTGCFRVPNAVPCLPACACDDAHFVCHRQFRESRRRFGIRIVPAEDCTLGGSMFGWDSCTTLVGHTVGAVMVQQLTGSL
jgi:hypothetical protein